MPTYANLLDKHGYKYKAKIHDDSVSGEIVVEHDCVYLLQNLHSGFKPTSGTKDYKWSWSVLNGSPDTLAREHVTCFELVDDHTAKFPVGTRVKLATGCKEPFRFGGDTSTISSKYGTVTSNYGWQEAYKSCQVLVKWDQNSAGVSHISYSMLENELELFKEEAKPAPRDIPGVHKFKVGDKVRIRSGIGPLVFTGAIRGDERDNGEVRSCENFNRTYKCMTVGVKFADGRNYTMSEDELEFLPSAPAFHMYVTSDIAELNGKLWIVIQHASDSINMENEEGAKCLVLNHEFHLLTLRGHTEKMPIISVGDYLKAEHIETYAGWSGGKSPVGIIPPMATIRVTAVGKYHGLSSDPYHEFSFEWKGDIYDASQGKRNIYTKCGSSGLHLKDVAPHLIEQEYLGITPIEWHISSSPDMGHITPMTDEQLRRAREMRYGGDPIRVMDPFRYMYEPTLMPDLPEKKIDPKQDREKYFCVTDPFEKILTPTPDLIMKKEKKFSL